MIRFVALVLPLAFAACASTSSDKNGEVYTERVYRTGSNLPVKDPTSRSDARNVDPEEVRRALERARPSPMTN